MVTILSFFEFLLEIVGHDTVEGGGAAIFTATPSTFFNRRTAH
jgi:hypothetical protein